MAHQFDVVDSEIVLEAPILAVRRDQPQLLGQLRGQGGPRQVAGARNALVHGTGGTLSSAATCILSTN